MKTIIRYVREYFREEWNALLFGTTGLFLAVAIALNYHFDAETAVIRTLRHPGWQFLFYLLLYAIPFIITIAAWSITKKRSPLPGARTFWWTTLFTFSVLSAYVVLHILPWYFLMHHSWVFASIREDLRIIVLRSAGNLFPLVFAAPVLLLYWYRMDRARLRPYGLDARTIDLKPYFLILLLLAPVIFAVSFSGDFQRSYPRYKFGFPSDVSPVQHAGLLLMYEFCYGADFLFVEFFFRGFMVLGLARLLDDATREKASAAILPMVAVYAFIHFQKPMVEAVSSIAGGLVLGVIAYRTKSIYGGIILHLGVAYMMELAGAFHLYGR